MTVQPFLFLLRLDLRDRDRDRDRDFIYFRVEEKMNDRVSGVKDWDWPNHLMLINGD